jgi:hypothetical protein
MKIKKSFWSGGYAGAQGGGPGWGGGMKSMKGELLPISTTILPVLSGWMNQLNFVQFFFGKTSRMQFMYL